jgi:hypothetical protein
LQVLVTSLVLKNNVTLVDIISTRMMGQYGFLATVFDVFRKHKLSVDVVATSEVGCRASCGGSETLHARKREWGTGAGGGVCTRGFQASTTTCPQPQVSSTSVADVIVSPVPGCQRLHHQACQEPDASTIQCQVVSLSLLSSTLNFHSQVSVSLTLDPKKITDMANDLRAVKEELDKIATVSYRYGCST